LAGVNMSSENPGLTREELTACLRRRWQRLIPVKWDDFSDRYAFTFRDRLQRCYERWGKDYLQVSPWYRHTPVGEDAGHTVHAGRRGGQLRGFSPGFSDYADEWGCLWKTTDADEVGGNCIEHPYASLDDALGARLPDPELPQRLDPIRQAREQSPDRFIWVQNWLGPWEMSRAMLGTESILVATIAEKKKLQRFLGRMFEHFQELTRRICTLEVDMVGLGDDWGTERSLLIDPDAWVEIFKPLYRNLFDEIKRTGKISLFHSCGAVLPLYPHLLDLGVDVINPVQPGPVSIEEAGRNYRGKVSFFGGLDTRRLLEKGGPEEVEDEVAHIVRTLGVPNGGLIVGHCTSVHSGTPIENIEAMFRAAREYRWQ
jgi:uroporphyrinogen decarboxylase